MWGGHSCPPPLTWILSSENCSASVTKINFKSGGQECPPHIGSPRNQFERRITPQQLAKSIRRRPGRHWKIPLNFLLELIQIGLQNLRLLLLGERPEPELQPRT